MTTVEGCRASTSVEKRSSICTLVCPVTPASTDPGTKMPSRTLADVVSGGSPAICHVASSQWAVMESPMNTAGPPEPPPQPASARVNSSWTARVNWVYPYCPGGRRVHLHLSTHALLSQRSSANMCAPGVMHYWLLTFAY